MRFNRLIAATAAGAMLFVAAMCSSAARAEDAIKMATVGNVNAISWPKLIAEHEGMFAAEGLKMDVVFVRSSSLLVQQLAAGSVDLGFSMGMIDPIRAAIKGAPVAIARLQGQVSPFALVGKPAIKTIDQLKGKTIMIGGPKDVTRFYLDRMLTPHGLKNGDYDLVYAGATPARLAALKSGAVDAAMMFPPFNFFALHDGFSDLGNVVDYAPDLPFSVTAVNSTWASAHKAEVEKFNRAVTKAIAWFNTDANRGKAIAILTDAMQGKGKSLAETYDFFRKIHYFEPTGKVSRKKIAEALTMLRSTGDVGGDFDMNKLFLPGVTEVTE